MSIDRVSSRANPETGVTVKNLILSLALMGCGAAEPAPDEPAHPTTAHAEGPESAAGPGTDPIDARLACAVAADCVLVEATCGGSIGVNAAHASEVAQEQINLRPVASCLAPPPVPPPVHVECIESVCTAVLTELPSAES